MAIFLGPSLVYVKPRIPVTLSSTDYARRRFDYSFIKSPVFLAFQAGNTLQGMGYFIPGIYLPMYSRSLGTNDNTTTATISLLNAISVFGCIFVGFLVDRVNVTVVLFILAVGSFISVFLVWGFSSNAPVLLAFCGMYGFFAGPYTTTYTGVVKEIQRQFPDADGGLIMGLLVMGRGIGSVSAGPISERLLQLANKMPNANVTSGYGSSYEPLIIFTGICVAFGGVGFGAKRLGWM
jgi:MFS family permease